jgi:hypothetical protein
MTATADITIKSRIMFLDLMWPRKRVQAASAKFLRLYVSERHNSSAGKGRCGLVLAVTLVIVRVSTKMYIGQRSDLCYADLAK